MTLFFKIFLLLFLQSAKQKGADYGMPISNLEQILVSSPTTLSVETDEESLDRVVIVCRAHDQTCIVDCESPDLNGKIKANIRFFSLAFSKREIMMKSWQGLNNRLQLEWKEQIPCITN
jgi:hypothetical protein